MSLAAAATTPAPGAAHVVALLVAASFAYLVMTTVQRYFPSSVGRSPTPRRKGSKSVSRAVSAPDDTDEPIEDDTEDDHAESWRGRTLLANGGWRVARFIPSSLRPAEVVDVALDDEPAVDEPAPRLGSRARRAARADEYTSIDSTMTYTDAYLALMDEFGISESSAKRDLREANARRLTRRD